MGTAVEGFYDRVDRDAGAARLVPLGAVKG